MTMRTRESEYIRFMLRMQRNLDREILDKMGMDSYPDPQRYAMAILDEIGELNHELKPKWCWWKKNPGSVDDKKVLEELVDVWHFCLSFANSVNFDPNEKNLTEILEGCCVIGDLSDFVASTYWEIVPRCDVIGVFKDVIALTKHLDFDVSDIFKAYIRKNEINHERARSDY